MAEQIIPAGIVSAMNRFSVVGKSPALVEAVDRAIKVAPYDLAVLVVGESGVGKEFFPKIVHQYSPRKHKKYIAVNCGAIPEGTIDSELFGHEKGSFTGAIAEHKGYFEEADGGTIFLDEVAEMPLTTQAKLLRVLESGEYLRLGSSEVRRTNIRVVAATNKDLPHEVREGRFREDLYYRLSTVIIHVPPLRDRGTDMLLLARKFTHTFAHDKCTPPVEFDDSARKAIMNYRWPGNVRQMKNVMEQIALFEAGNKVDASKVESYLPTTTEVLPATASRAKYDYTTDRDMLFGLINQMQYEIANLKAMIANAAQQHHVHISGDVAELRRQSSTALVKSSSSGLRIGGDTFTPPQRDGSVAAGSVHYVKATDVEADEEQPAIEVHEVKAQEDRHRQDEVKSLSDIERDTIIGTLERNGGRRKKTARELNISERTLYRKIKQYGLDSRSTRAADEPDDVD